MWTNNDFVIVVGVQERVATRRHFHYKEYFKGLDDCFSIYVMNIYFYCKTIKIIMLFGFELNDCLLPIMNDSLRLYEFYATNLMYLNWFEIKVLSSMVLS